MGGPLNTRQLAKIVGPEKAVTELKTRRASPKAGADRFACEAGNI